MTLSASELQHACLWTKAIHIIAVSDLSFSAFIAAYRRFVSRRRLPASMYSDNGTNFVGAAKVLRNSHKSKLQKVKSEIVHDRCYGVALYTTLIPTLWSLKFHLKPNIGNTKLKYEVLSALLTQIVACLNYMTSEPNDLTALTPAYLVNYFLQLLIEYISTTTYHLLLDGSM